ncbi:MAG: ferric reductase-like transmembrane domain-containing protein [Acidimicrobiales bacterium]|jgi:predicted ferric reductase|nr:ferric reductase-like transmembrane domain-containing protein [Acidimicrobiales bacterium]
MSTQTWWYVARASGLVAWALATASVLWGMALSSRALGRKPTAPWLLDLHRFLGGLTVVFTGVHLVGLWADSYVTFGPTELFVPFASSWKPAAVAAGVVAFWLLVAVELTSLAKRRLPHKLWRVVHLSSYGVFALATGHLLTAGTDASNPLVTWTAWASLGAVAFFTTYLVLGPGRAASVRRSGSRGPARGTATATVATATASPGTAATELQPAQR